MANDVDPQATPPAAPAQKPNIRVREPSFMLSAPTLAHCPPPVGREVAFIGRSNVGKSSLLNMLMMRKGLVKVSKTPGRTRDLNFFRCDLLVDDDAYPITVVDLPGYGYAQVSKKERARIGRMLTEYVDGRDGLGAVCQLFDIRHAPSEEDREVFEGLREGGFAHLLVATKGDKLKSGKRGEARKALAKRLGVRNTDVVVTSSESFEGRDTLWQRILKQATVVSADLDEDIA